MTIRSDSTHILPFGWSVPGTGATRYAARRWHRARRIIMKAEVLCYPGRAPKENLCLGLRSLSTRAHFLRLA
jgi:hypothetical protein